MEHSFTFFERYLPGVTETNLFLITSTFVTLLLLFAAFMVYPRIKNASQNVIPYNGIGLRSIFEILTETLSSLCDDVIGHDGRTYLPYLGTLFIFLLLSNLIGMIPGFLPPTEVWVTGAALGLISLIIFNYYGFKKSGIGYLKHFTAPLSIKGIKNPVLWTLVAIPFFAFQIFFTSIETVSILLRPITLAIRITMNISADHVVVGVFNLLAPYIIPIPFMILGLFICFMQAFVFTFLTMVYISMAVAHDH